MSHERINYNPAPKARDAATPQEQTMDITQKLAELTQRELAIREERQNLLTPARDEIISLVEQYASLTNKTIGDTLAEVFPNSVASIDSVREAKPSPYRSPSGFLFNGRKGIEGMPPEFRAELHNASVSSLDAFINNGHPKYGSGRWLDGKRNTVREWFNTLNSKSEEA